jgi:hypothetical protein
MMLTQNLTPQAAVDQLIELHAKATASLKSCLERYFSTRQAPSADERSSFCYPQLRVTYESQGVQPSISRAFANSRARALTSPPSPSLPISAAIWWTSFPIW